MNIVWVFGFVLSVGFLLIFEPDAVLATLNGATSSAFALSLSLVAVYSLWMGIMQILSDCGLVAKLSKLIRPLLKKLFSKEDEAAFDDISLNIAANLVGVGNAATPSALSAIKKMDRGGEKATPNMMMLFILNCSSLQILPTTIIGIRTALGSANPSDIVLPTLVVSVLTTLFVVAVMKLWQKYFYQKSGRRKTGKLDRQTGGSKNRAGRKT